MNWILKDKYGKVMVELYHYGCVIVDPTNISTKDPLQQPLTFHGTRDYVDGVIFALELMGHEKYIPELQEEPTHVES